MSLFILTRVSYLLILLESCLLKIMFMIMLKS